MSEQQGSDNQSEKQLRAVFDFFDTDGTGRLEVDELESVMNSLGQCITKEEVQKIIEDEALSPSKGLDFDEFVSLFQKYGKEGNKVSREIKEAFEVFDRKRKGYLTQDDLYAILTKFNQFEVSREEADMCFNSFDNDHNGQMDYNEFANFLSAMCVKMEDLQRLKH